jgi:hypothetical protein
MDMLELYKLTFINTFAKIGEMRAVEYHTFFTDQGEKRQGPNRLCQI